MDAKDLGPGNTAPPEATDSETPHDSREQFSLCLLIARDDYGEPVPGTAELRYEDRTVMGLGQGMIEHLADLVIECRNVTEEVTDEDFTSFNRLPEPRNPEAT